MEEFLIYLLKSAGLLIAFQVFYLVLLKKDTSFITNRRFLLGGLVTSAILPAIYFTRTVIIKASPSQFQWAESTFPINEINVQESLFTPIEIIAGIYFLGVILMTLRLLLQFYSLSKVLFTGNLSKKENVRFIKTERKIAPFSFLNYVVYNPSLHTQSELDYILKHEKVHVNQGHTFDVLLANFNLIYQWFNPFAWLYLKNIQQNLEFIADSEAVKKASCKKEYQKALVKISVDNFNLALTNNFYQSLIKKRIIMLNRSTSGKSSSWKALLIFPALLTFIFLFNIKTVAQVVTEEQEKKSSYELSSDFEISFQIQKTSNKEQLGNYSKALQKYNVNLEFENITRNEAGLLTGITVNFLDKNNNSSGSISRQNKNGIKSFVIYYSEKDGAGFRSPTEAQESGTHSVLRNLGLEPLIILEGKQLNIAQLEGKAIKILGDVGSVNSIKALKTYGNDAKDGALIITKGEIIEDLNAEFSKIDNQDKNEVRDYIQFDKGKPMLINLNKKASTNVTGSGRSINNSADAVSYVRSNPAVTFKDLNIPGKNPVYIVNGKVLGNNAIIDTINPENISAVSVLKGSSATAVYGKEAKDGAISITTRKAGDTTGFSFRTGNSILKDSAKSKNIIYRASNVRYVSHDSLSPSRRNLIFSNSNPQYIDAPLYIVDGKEMNEDFEMSSIDNDKIAQINVIKTPTAIEKYGDKAKGGAVEITSKKNKKIDMGTMAVITPAATLKELQDVMKTLKDSGIQADFENVKRNKAGVITAIKLSARYNGEHLTYSASETEGINPVYIGTVNNKLRITSQL